MLPVKELKERSRKLSLGESEEGISPEKLFCCRCTDWREGRERISDGRLPLRKLDRRLRIVSSSSFPRVLAGMGPYNPTPGSRRAITRVPFGSHDTPPQEEQIGELDLQLIFRLCGTTAAKFRRACLSILRSAMVCETRKRNKSTVNGAKELCSFMDDFLASVWEGDDH